MPPSTVNKKLLIVGAGSIGERHAKAFRQMGVSVAIIDPQVDRAREVASRHGCSPCYRGLREAPLGQFDAAVIATPADTHIPIARECAKAGLHLLVEKPLATTLTGTAELIAECQQENLTLAIAYVLRFHSTLQRVRQICQQGTMGRLLSVEAVCHHYLPWSRPDYRQTYYASATGGGGVVLDLSHETNYVEWLLGPLTLLNSTLATVPELEIPGEAIADLSLTSEEGVPVRIHLNAADRVARRQCHIAGSRGSLTADLLTGEVILHDPSGRNKLGCRSERDDWHWRQAKNFLEAVINGSKPGCTGEEGLWTLRVCLEALSRNALAVGQRGPRKADKAF